MLGLTYALSLLAGACATDHLFHSSSFLCCCHHLPQAVPEAVVCAEMLYSANIVIALVGHHHMEFVLLSLHQEHRRITVS